MFDTVKLAYWKSEARRHYLTIRAYDDVRCGEGLLRDVSETYTSAITGFWNAWDNIRKLDPDSPEPKGIPR